MERSEEQGPSRIRLAAAVLPEDVIVWEILVRLPAKDLLRCRAVCRAWRRRTSAADFLLSHHHQQPQLLLVHTHGRPIAVYAAIDAMDLRRRPTELQPVLRVNDHRDGRGRLEAMVEASCDGLLLLSVQQHIGLSNRRFYLCNPATRQWISVPWIRGNRVLGMYSHRPTGEYRVLYWKRANPSSPAVYYVLSVGSTEPRCIEQPISSPSVRTFVEFGLTPDLSNVRSSVLLHDCMYWIFPEQKGIVVFDTTRESFRLICLPTEACQFLQYPGYWDLLDIDGALGISWGGLQHTMLKLWVLHDYETGASSLEHQIEYSVAELGCVVQRPKGMRMIVSKDGDALIYCYNSMQVFHLDCKGKLLQTLRRDGLFPFHTGIRFKESLVRHAFFEGPREAAPSGEPQFFVGL